MPGTGTPAGLSQNLTSGEFRGQNEIFISPGQSCGETSIQARIYATVGDFASHSCLSTKRLDKDLRIAPVVVQALLADRQV